MPHFITFFNINKRSFIQMRMRKDYFLKNSIIGHLSLLVFFIQIAMFVSLIWLKDSVKLSHGQNVISVLFVNKHHAHRTPVRSQNVRTVSNQWLLPMSSAAHCPKGLIAQNISQWTKSQFVWQSITPKSDAHCNKSQMFLKFTLSATYRSTSPISLHNGKGLITLPATIDFLW